MSLFKPLENLETKSSSAQPEGEVEHVKCLILGSGPAGYTAAIYAARANLSPVMYEGLQPGGQLTTTTEVENFPGYPNGITGPEMMEDLKKQAARFGADIRYGYATSADFSSLSHKVVIDEKKVIVADSVIIATGATAKYLGLPSEEKFKGFGVSACATCDGFFYKNKVVAVVGGGDTAAEEATYLAGLCKKVYMIVRRDVLRASKAMQNRVKNTGNIEVLHGYITKEIVGDDMGVNGVILTNAEGKDLKIDIDGFFCSNWPRT
jgi:thioredoxin reductase (NADPH)